MKLRVPWHDIRRLGGSIRSDSVIDEDAAKSVGYVLHSAHSDGIRRRISLFGGKYEGSFATHYEGSFATHEECVAFARGVEAVLNHMVLVKAERSSEQEPATTATA
jgi:hypothetical protein